jgi:hypothetical protein
MERIKEMQFCLSVQPEKANDPEDPNANGHGDVWIISVSLHQNADNLYVCTDGKVR